MEQDGFGPALTGTQHITVGETTAGGETGEAGQGHTTRDDVGHVDIDSGEAGGVEGESHLSLAVHTLLTQNGNTGLVVEGRVLGQTGHDRQAAVLGVESRVP